MCEIYLSLEPASLTSMPIAWSGHGANQTNALIIIIIVQQFLNRFLKLCAM